MTLPPIEWTWAEFSVDLWVLRYPPAAVPAAAGTRSTAPAVPLASVRAAETASLVRFSSPDGGSFFSIGWEDRLLLLGSGSNGSASYLRADLAGGYPEGIWVHLAVSL